MSVGEIIIIASLSGVIVGLILMGAIIFLKMPSMMLLENQSKYDFVTTVEKFQASVTKKGWKIIFVHNMQEKLKEFGHDVLEVKIFEICSSKYSAKILELDDERVVSSLMPCRVSIYLKSNGNTYVSRMNSKLMAIPMGGVIAEVMSLAAVETEAILDAIIG